MSECKRLAILIFAALLSILFVSCDLNYHSNTASASFYDSVSKALNQTGSATSTDSVSDYYWTYYAGTELPDSDSQFVKFDGLNGSDGSYNKGIGVIRDLLRGESYYFALKAFAACDNNEVSELRWYGVSELTKIVSATTPVKVELEAAGNGTCEFVITAPTDMTSATDLRFEIEIKQLDGESEQTIIGGSVEDNRLSFRSSEISMNCGCYLATVREQYTVNGTDYGYVENRAQVIIVNIVSGVKTTVKGSLDSTREAN